MAATIFVAVATYSAMLNFLTTSTSCYDTYRRLARILPLLSDGMTVPAFLDNVLDHHLEVYEKELDEMVRLSTQNSH